jgi:enoyl-CoA hydratase/carnithine racemase
MTAGQAAPGAQSANEPLLVREHRDGVCTLTLNRPAQYNALSEALLDELQAALDGVAADPSVRVVVLTGSGKAFCAGHDLKEMRSRPDQSYYTALFDKCSRMMLSLLNLPQPVIARVHGMATAAGCQLVATCDLAVASNAARFGASGINVGLFCMTPSVALARNLNRKDAFEMTCTGDLIDAERAREIGLINRTVAPEALDEAVAALAGRILDKSAAAIAAGKRVFYRQLELGVAEAYALAGREMACNMMFEDAAEGIDAFIAKRPPQWRHR